METGRSSALQKYCVILLMGGLLISRSAYAEIYSCEKNGIKEFSQQPCGESAVIVQNSGEDSLQIVVPMTNEDITRICRLVLKGWDFAVASRRENYPRARYQVSTRSYVSPRDYVLSKISNLREIEKSYPSLYALILSAAGSANTGGSTYPAQNTSTYQIDRDQVERQCNVDLQTRMESGYRVRKRRPSAQ
jgi:hypothetical protein